ncbi:hypothetical protein [Nocardia sienata]|uniref:hypothetical protein n=1 Tax=Nocardia sienata TaxID=248552 RepID=UPI0007A4545D|nr:hypothetical protein [Nocardia sienata]
MSLAPTIVLVHGAFADASSWHPVIERLLADGHRVCAPGGRTQPGRRRGRGPRLNPEVERFGYRRAALRSIVEIDAPHLVTHTHPAEVAAVLTGALAELS